MTAIVTTDYPLSMTVSAVAVRQCPEAPQIVHEVPFEKSQTDSLFTERSFGKHPS